MDRRLFLVSCVATPWLVPARYVAAGDSLTAPRPGVTGYVDLLASRDANDLTVYNEGMGGWTVTRLRGALRERVTAHAPAVVSFMFGTNDHAILAGRSRPRVGLGMFRAVYRDVLANAGCRVVLMTPPFVMTGVNRVGTELSNDRLTAYSRVVREIAHVFRVGLVDVHRITTELCGGRDDVWRADFAPDGVHLNSAAHAAIYPHIRDAIL